MDTALRWANELGSIPTLPLSLQDVSQRAKLVRDINTKPFADALFADYLGNLSSQNKSQYLAQIASITSTHIHDVDNADLRQNLSLRLWAGCLSAAKMISPKTLDGLNTPDKRESSFKDRIDPEAQKDPIYRAGVEAAPDFKKLLGEDYSFEGVPVNSPLGDMPPKLLKREQPQF